MPDESKNKAESAATDNNHRFIAKTPDFTPKWSRDWVIPDNVLDKANIEVEAQVDSKYPENRPKAEITAMQEWDKGSVPEVKLPSLKLKDKKVVDEAGSRPKHKFSHENRIWDTYDKLDYHFECSIDQTKKQTSKPLKVKRWHVQAVDTGDTRLGFPAMRASEKANFLNSYSGKPDDERNAWEFDAGTTAGPAFGEKMQNTYTFVYTGHGAVMCSNCGKMFENLGVKTVQGLGDLWTKVTDSAKWEQLSDAQFGTWTACLTPSCYGGSPRSTHCIGGRKKWPTPSFVGGDEIAKESIVANTPKYLMFSICCGGAFESSLYNAYISRGTKHCVGFKKSTRCDWARDYAKAFFDKWVGAHKCDPAKIPAVFNALLGTWETKLQPALFPEGGTVSGSGADLRAVGEHGI